MQILQSNKQVTSTDLELYEHEDAEVSFQFDDSDLDRLEQYEMEFYDDELLASDDAGVSNDDEMARILKELTFPFSSKEPDLTAEELTRLDALADRLELDRLEKLSVLQDPSTVPANSKVLSTRFVRTWREKHSASGEPIGFADQGLWLVNLLGLSQNVKVCFLQLLATSSPEWFLRFSWRYKQLRAWRWFWPALMSETHSSQCSRNAQHSSTPRTQVATAEALHLGACCLAREMAVFFGTRPSRVS